MNDKASRKKLIEQYRQSRPDAGVYRIVNRITGRWYLGSDTDINTMAGKMDFARNTGMYGILPGNLQHDIKKDGFENFSLEILERMPVKPETTPQELKEELKILEALWNEKLSAENRA